MEEEDGQWKREQTFPFWISFQEEQQQGGYAD